MSAQGLQPMPNTAPVKLMPSAGQPVLLEATINLTLRTIERRAWMYRNLVIAVSLTMIAPVLVAVLLRRWMALLGVLALPIHVRGYLFLDSRIPIGWRRDVLRRPGHTRAECGAVAADFSGV